MSHCLVVHLVGYHSGLLVCPYSELLEGNYAELFVGHYSELLAGCCAELFVHHYSELKQKQGKSKAIKLKTLYELPVISTVISIVMHCKLALGPNT